MLGQPLEGGFGMIEHGDVTVLAEEPELGRRAVPRQPLTVRAGHDCVLAAVDEQQRRGDQGRIETPVPDVGQIVVDQAARTSLKSRG